MMTWLTRDWGIKLISLFLAIGLWYYAVGEEGIEVTRTVPIEITLKNPQMSILKTSANVVRVTFIAPRAVVSSLASDPKIVALHEIGNEAKSAGEYSFRVEPREISVNSPQVRIAGINPEIITVTIDELLVQKLKVAPNFAGEPAFGYKVIEAEMQLNPNAVLIEGPKGVLEKMESVPTEKIDLVGRVRSFRRTVELALPQNLKPLSEALIDVYIPIREESEEREFKDIPVKVLDNSTEPRRITTEPSQVTFVLKGTKTQIAQMKPETLLIYADVSALGDGDHEVPLQMVLPDGVGPKDEKPLTVKALIRKG